MPSEEITENNDTKYVLKHYIALLNNITIDIMDNKEIVDILNKEEYFETMLAIVECEKDFFKRIKEEFVDKLRQQAEDKTYIWSNPMDNKYEITKDSWTYVIEKYGNSGYWRGLKYTGNQIIQIDKIERKWEKKDKGFPLGWDYFEGDLADWTNPSTLRKMRNGEFQKIIIKEVDNVFSYIDNNI